MSQDVVVLKFGEIFLKGQNRGYFEQKLLDGVKRATAGMKVRVDHVHARVLVEVEPGDRERAVSRLSRVFGVQKLSPARVVPGDLDAVTVEAVVAMEELLARRPPGRTPPTFKVDCRRSDKSFPIRSDEVSAHVGYHIINATGLTVDVHHPDITIGIEIGPHRTFVFAETLMGPGGLPVGASGRVNLLISGGIDSPVAGWLAMKRGCNLLTTYFHSFPYTGDKTKEKVTALVRLLAAWQGPTRLVVPRFTDTQKALRNAGAAELAVVLYRRMMLRTAAVISRRMGAAALCTGDNLAQVASQTLINLGVIEEATDMMVLRPLLTNDKHETVALARRLGTFETSIQPYDDCCSLFVPSHPATSARLADVHKAEARLDVVALADKLADDAEIIEVTP